MNDGLIELIQTHACVVNRKVNIDSLFPFKFLDQNKSEFYVFKVSNPKNWRKYLTYSEDDEIVWIGDKGLKRMIKDFELVKL